jgi:T6SS immunity protein Tdi1, C-terminal
MDWKRLTIDVAGLDCNRLLSDWRWLVPESLRPFSLTMFGDWFFEDSAGRVIFLDTVAAQLSEIAPSRQAFLTERARQENLDQWFMADLALLCWERGLRPGPGQCLSFKIAPVLSGPLEVDNIEVCDLMVHESIQAQIHRGVKDLPEGTVINRFLVDGEEP